MQREQLDHILRAAAAIADRDRFVVIGSQAILATVANPPPDLIQSIEVDLYAPDDPHASDLLDATIGELSPFHQTFGYYAHGIARETAVLPEGWEDRLVPYSSPAAPGVLALCLEPHDLAVAKLAAARHKDTAFVATMIQEAIVDPDEIARRIEHTSVPTEKKQQMQAALIRSRRSPNGGDS